MMSAYGLTAYTIRLFDRQTDDWALNELFTQALKNSPAIVLLEDIDRAFPRTGESECGISLQHLLNTLDGIATGEGIIVVATANEPVLLDPAILKRPGRFDRTVFFGAPDPPMRASYFNQRVPSLPTASLETLAKASDGFSFAQLREAYIIAGQRAFIAQRGISLDDLLEGAETLRGTTVAGSRHSHASGF
jgi:ATP-dependent 26S proteasome regulatory subunit